MKRIALIVGLAAGLVAAPAAGQTRVSVGVRFGAPHVSGYVVIGRPHYRHRHHYYRSEVIVVDRPRYYAARVIVVPRRHVHRRYHRHQHDHHPYYARDYDDDWDEDDP